jgi:hypothetical protein
MDTKPNRMGTYFAGDLGPPFARARITIARKRVRRRARVRTCIDHRPVPFELGTAFVPKIMNIELKEMQQARRERLALESEG